MLANTWHRQMWGNASLLKPGSYWLKAQFLQHSSLTHFSMSLCCTNMSQHGRKPRLYCKIEYYLILLIPLRILIWEGLIQKLLFYKSTSLPSAPSKLGTNLIPSCHSFQGHGRTRSYLDGKGNQVAPQNIYIYISNITKWEQENEMDEKPPASLFKNKKILWNDWSCLRVERIVTVRSIRPGLQPEPDRVCVLKGYQHKGTIVQHV